MLATAVYIVLSFALTAFAQDLSSQLEDLFFECGSRALAPPSGQFNSPFYPANYPDHSNCGYAISVDEDSVIKITFHDYDFDKGLDEFGEIADYISILDGPFYRNMDEYFDTADADLPYEYLSSTNNIDVRFITDGSGNARGFNATYIAVPWEQSDEEDGDVFLPDPFPDPFLPPEPFLPDPAPFECTTKVMGSPNGQFNSPSYPFGYPGNTTCQYFIGVGEGNVIEITFHDIDLTPENFGIGDRIIITEGDQGVYLDFTSNTDVLAPAVYRSNSNFLTIRFESQDFAVGRGFNATYESWNNVDYCDAASFEARGPFSVECENELRSGFYKMCKVTCNTNYILRRSSKVTCVEGMFLPPKPCKLIDWYVQMCEITNMAYCPYSSDELGDHFSERYAGERLSEKELSDQGLDVIPDPAFPPHTEPALKPFLNHISKSPPTVESRCSDRSLKYSYCDIRKGTKTYAFSCQAFLKIKQMPKKIANAKMYICYLCRRTACMSNVFFG